MKLKIIPAVIVLLCFAYGCSKSGDTAGGGSTTVYTPNCSTTKTFSGDASPVFQTICSACHGAGSTNGPGELTTYAQVFNARSAIRAAVASGRMPKTGSLSNTQKDAILCWIDSGAPNN